MDIYGIVDNTMSTFIKWGWGLFGQEQWYRNRVQNIYR